MQLIPHPPEKRAKARWLGETTTMSCTAIAAQVEVPASTVRAWKRIDGWKRPPGAPTRRVLSAADCDAIARMQAGGARNADIARVARRHPDTVARAARRGSERRAAEAAPVAAPFAASAPEEVAALRQGLLAGGLGRRELLGLVRRTLALATVDLIDDRTLPPDRRAQGLARIAITIKTLPDDAPAAGAASHDHQSGPATFEETNALLEEIACRYEAFCARGEREGVPGDAVAVGAAAPS
jgi:hypothetical protein